ncbi:MAG: hypothetical protein M3453_16320 [Pseudomonadota bacterium]|nr:hypothetical protein [Pseudomonadota bacterium]
MLQVTAIGGDHPFGVAGRHGLGHLAMLRYTVLDDARHCAGDAPHVEPDIVQPLRCADSRRLPGASLSA